MALLGRRAGRVIPSGMSHHTVVTWEDGIVRAAVLRLSEGSAEILGLAAAPVDGISATSHPDPDRWCAACDRALAQSEDMTLRLAGRKIVPDHATMAIPSSVTRSLSIMDETRRRNARKPVTFDELQGMLRRGYRKAQDHLDVRARGSREDIVAGSLASITLDGQPVSDPLGLVGDNLQIGMCFFLAPAEWIRSLQLISERLGLDLATILPHHMALASPLADTAALMVVVDDALTTVDLVRRGHVEWAASVPYGGRALIEGAVADLGVPERQLEALMRTYRAGQLRDDVEQRMSGNYWRSLRIWMGMVADQVTAVAPDTHVPYRVYCHDVTGRVPEIVPALATPYWEQKLRFGRCPKIEALDPGAIRAVLDCTAQANGTPYLLLRSLVNYVARLYAPGNDLDRALTDSIRWRPGG
jgi:hypothetical protein